MSSNGDRAPADGMEDLSKQFKSLMTDPRRNDLQQNQGWSERVSYDYNRYLSDVKQDGEGDQNTAFNSDQHDSGFDFQPIAPWESEAKKYEWDGEAGEIGPPDKEIEAELFRKRDQMRAGDDLDVLATIEVNIEGKTRPQPILNFADAGLHPQVLENVSLALYSTPTPVQSYVIPTIMQGYDVVACAQTGSGKTAAFLIPIISKLMGKAKKLCAPRPSSSTDSLSIRSFRAEPLVVIVVPTRELACQIFREACRLCYRSMLRPCVIYGGGDSMKEQIADLRKGCDILVGTPGRLCHFMGDPRLLTLSRVKYTVIDEADEMLDVGWEADIRQIVSGGDTNEDADHVFMMFSATFPKAAAELAEDFTTDDYVKINVGRSGSSHRNIEQQVVQVEGHDKQEKLFELLITSPPARTLVFVNSKRTAERLDDFLFNRQLPSTSIHSDRTQREREDALRAFTTGTCPILIATGLASRGIDIRNILHVVNYDLPSIDNRGIEEYVHRIGRTGRIGNKGLATAFYTERDEGLAKDLVKILLETDQPIPDFLEEFRPRNNILNFDEDGSDFEEENDQSMETGESGDGMAVAPAASVTW